MIGIRALLLLLLASGVAAAQPRSPLTGIVLDPSGGPISNASVRAERGGATLAETRSAADGRFALDLERRDGVRVTATADGFAPGDASAPEADLALTITLEPAPFFEAVNVTSSRTDAPTSNPTATVTVISSSRLLESAPLTLDDALKMVPGFTLFRRTTSRTSNPTAQGIAMRGIGGSGPSRSLVLADGIPLNDAFGGWVYWSKVPQAAIDRVEVQRGSGSDLYGADAVGGVVQVLTMRPTRPTARVLLEGGSLGTGRTSAFGGGSARGWRYGVGGEWFTIDGYVPIATEQSPGIAARGPVDSNLGSTHRSGIASAGYQASNGWRVGVSGNYYDEDRENGSALSINSTTSRQGAADTAGAVGGGLLTVRGYGGTQDYHQTFTTINATRTTEALNRDQQVPTSTAGIGAQWFRALGVHSFLVGAEGRSIEGRTIETPFAQGRPLATTDAGGRQRAGSAFVQDTIRASDRLTLVFGAHSDGWRSRSRLTGFTQTSGAFNPRASAAYRVGESGVTVRGSAYRAFRPPTLNEFYRSFSAGNTQTRPNDALGPERLTGGDVGISVSRGRASARVTGYWNVLDGAITAITLSSTPTQIIRQRANADTLRAEGIEIEADLRLPQDFSISFASGFVRSRYTGDTSPLRNKRTPQIPRYNLGLDLRYQRAGWTGSAQVRVTGPQFEDDQNAFTLRRATVVDVLGSRSIAGKVSAFVAVENLFDEIYDVGRTPTLTIGMPRAARAGVLITLP